MGAAVSYVPCPSDIKGTKITHRADTAIPADDPARKLTVAQPDDPNLSHIGLVGDTYTILVAGKDTQGRYCLIDMHIPPGGGPPPHRHDFEEMFSVLEGEIEASFRGIKTIIRSGETINIPGNALTNSKIRVGNQRDCYAFARRQDRKSFSGKSAFPSQRGQHHRLHLTGRQRRRSQRRLKRLLPNIEQSFYALKVKTLGNKIL